LSVLYRTCIAQLRNRQQLIADHNARDQQFINVAGLAAETPRLTDARREYAF
jgi:hypothetical protein